MPVDEDGIGRSDNTEWKQRTIEALFRAWVTQVRGICDRRGFEARCSFVDLTAGNGDSEFLRSLRSIMPNVKAIGFERVESNYRKLYAAGIFDIVCCGDWKEHISTIAQSVRGDFAFVYHDSNSEYRTEHASLLTLANEATKADFAIHLDAQQIKRVRKAGYGYVPLSDLLNIRKGGCIREPYGTKSQWTIAYQSNCPLSNYKRFGFYGLETDNGKRIVRELELTKEERAEQATTGSGYLFPELA